MAVAKPHNYNYTMQKYLLLQEQHAELSTHLDQIRPRQSSLSSASSVSSPASSPSRADEPPVPQAPRRHSRRSDGGRHTKGQARYSGWCENRRGSVALDTIPDEETLYEISAEEQRLFDVNESIKRALTEMLNCNVVRSDNSMRMWAQTRLMEAEKELRSGRRRRGSPCRD